MTFPRARRTRNRLIIMFIIFACLTSLYILLLKVRKMIHLSQMEENSRHFAIFNDILYYNSTQSKSVNPSLMFLITSQITNFYLPMVCDSNDGYKQITSTIALNKVGDSLIMGKCEVTADPLYVSLKLDDFLLQIDVPPPLFSASKLTENTRDEHILCMSHLVLYEDGATILSLLKYFKNSATKIYIYAASVSDHLFAEINKSSDKVELVPWMLPESRKHDDFDKLKLDPNYATAAIEGSLTHCFLKYAPIVKKVTLIDLATLRFNSIPFIPDYTPSPNVTKFVNDNWKIDKLTTLRVTINSQNDVVLNEKCFIKKGNSEEECGELMNSSYNYSSSRIIYIPKIVEFDNLSIYADALGRCTSYKSTMEDRRNLMKFEFELENRVSAEVCEIELLRDDFKCRVAMDYNKKMFRRRTRLLITNKRAFLRFRDGCHL